MATAIPIADEIAIRNLVSRYAWALDTGDVEALVACFCRDGLLVWDAFDMPGRWHGEAALRHFASFFRNEPSSAGRQHHITNLLLQPDGDDMLGKAYVAVALRQGDGPHLLNVMGWYEDRYRREDGEWRLAERAIRDWSGPVLSNIAGQDGKHVARPLPPPLAKLFDHASEE